MRRHAVLLLFSSFTGLTRESYAQGVVQFRADWDAFRQHAPHDPTALAHALDRYREAYGLPLSFWPRSNADSSQLTPLHLDDHPCGRSLRAFVRAIPLGHPILEAERVLEIDSAGRELRRWAMPIDRLVSGLRGNELLTPAWLTSQDSLGRTILAIMPDGRFRGIADTGPGAPEPFDCPPLSDFKGSDYVGCWLVRDLVTRQPRRLAYQGPCT